MPMQRSYDGPFTYVGPTGKEGRCYLQVYQEVASLPLVVAVELADNPGTSITNAAEQLGTRVWTELLPHAREGFRLIEVYRRRTSTGALDETFDDVTFTLAGQVLDNADWQHMTRAQVETIIGQPLIIPVESSY